MKYFEFIDEMAKRVKMCFDKEVSVEVHKVVKNNSMEYDSLIINEPGRNVTPNFYLQGMYSRYVQKFLNFTRMYYREHPLTQKLSTPRS